MDKKSKTPKKRGRPPKPLDKARLKDDLSQGLTKQEAFKNQNLNSEYACTMEKKDPQLSQVVKEGREEFLEREVYGKKAFIVSAFWNKIAEGDTSAIIYGMKTVVGLKESRTLEVSGEISHVHSLSPEERQKRIAALRQELEQQIVDVDIEADENDSSRA